VLNITSNAILDVVIGLAFFYFLLSIVCSAINEGIATVLNLRAKNLEKGIRQLLKDPDDFYRHWRVAALHGPRWFGGKRRPSYIPPRIFALTVLDTASGSTDADTRDLIERAQAAVESEHTPRIIRGMLRDALDEARGDRDRLRASIERSYDEMMERVSGWYKRTVQLILFLIAIAVVAGINADSFTIGQRLWKDDAVRSAVVAQANKTIANTQAECTQAETSTDTTQAGTELTAAEKAAKCLDQIKELGIPVGWTSDTSPHSWEAVLGKIFGLLLTVFAVQLGAPFWFDLLGKVSRLRGSGNPPSSGSSGSPSSPSQPGDQAPTTPPPSGPPAAPAPGGG
jgi:hypothetical protein